MKIDPKKVENYSHVQTKECKSLLNKLSNLSRNELIPEIDQIKVWNYGKSDLGAWVHVLNTMDSILEEASTKAKDCKWTVSIDCPTTSNETLIHEVTVIMDFTAILVEHTIYRHFYASLESIIKLLYSFNMDIVLSALSLLYTFGKRSNFFFRLDLTMKKHLAYCLECLAETWSAKESQISLRDFSTKKKLPINMNEVCFEYVDEATSSLKVLKIPAVDTIGKSPSEILEESINSNQLSQKNIYILFLKIRLAACINNIEQRRKCIKARLQSLSILCSTPKSRSGSPLSINERLLYSELVEELLDVLRLPENALLSLKATVIRTLTGFFNCIKPSLRWNSFIELSGLNNYHGLLPELIRNAITKAVTASVDTKSGSVQRFYISTLLSFMHHLLISPLVQERPNRLNDIMVASYLEPLLSLITTCHSGTTPFVSRTIRIVDKLLPHLTNRNEFEAVMNAIILRLANEINSNHLTIMKLDSINNVSDDSASVITLKRPISDYDSHELLIRSLIVMLKRLATIPECEESLKSAMSNDVLPNCLMSILSEERYESGYSMPYMTMEFLAAFISQNPSELSHIQDLGLTDAILNIIQSRSLPHNREFLIRLPRILCVLSLNYRGAEAVANSQIVKRLVCVLINPTYLNLLRGEGSASYAIWQIAEGLEELSKSVPAIRLQVFKVLGQCMSYVIQLNTTSVNNIDMATNSAISKASLPTENDQSLVMTSFNDDLDSKVLSFEQISRVTDICDVTQELHSSTRVNANTSPLVTVSSNESSINYSGNSLVIDASQLNTNNKKSAIILEEQVYNICKFSQSLLQSMNNSHQNCSTFVNSGSVVSLLKLCTLKNLPLDFSQKQSCSVAGKILLMIMNSLKKGEALNVFNSLLTELEIKINLIAPVLSQTERDYSVMLCDELGVAPNSDVQLPELQDKLLSKNIAAINTFLHLTEEIIFNVQNDLQNELLRRWIIVDIIKPIGDLLFWSYWECGILIFTQDGITNPVSIYKWPFVTQMSDYMRQQSSEDIQAKTRNGRVLYRTVMPSKSEGSECAVAFSVSEAGHGSYQTSQFSVTENEDEDPLIVRGTAVMSPPSRFVSRGWLRNEKLDMLNFFMANVKKGNINLKRGNPYLGVLEKPFESLLSLCSLTVKSICSLIRSLVSVCRIDCDTSGAEDNEELTKQVVNQWICVMSCLLTWKGTRPYESTADDPDTYNRRALFRVMLYAVKFAGVRIAEGLILGLHKWGPYLEILQSVDKSKVIIPITEVFDAVFAKRTLKIQSCKKKSLLLLLNAWLAVCERLLFCQTVVVEMESWEADKALNKGFNVFSYLELVRQCLFKPMSHLCTNTALKYLLTESTIPHILDILLSIMPVILSKSEPISPGSGETGQSDVTGTEASPSKICNRLTQQRNSHLKVRAYQEFRQDEMYEAISEEKRNLVWEFICLDFDLKSIKNALEISNWHKEEAINLLLDINSQSEFQKVEKEEGEGGGRDSVSPEWMREFSQKDLIDTVLARVSLRDNLFKILLQFCQLMPNKQIILTVINILEATGQITAFLEYFFSGEIGSGCKSAEFLSNSVNLQLICFLFIHRRFVTLKVAVKYHLGQKLLEHLSSQILASETKTYIYLLLDLIERSTNALFMKKLMIEAYHDCHSWMWFDDHAGLWHPYNPKTISEVDKAFHNGEMTAKFKIHQRPYEAEFPTLSQSCVHVRSKRLINLWPALKSCTSIYSPYESWILETANIVPKFLDQSKVSQIIDHVIQQLDEDTAFSVESLNAALRLLIRAIYFTEPEMNRVKDLVKKLLENPPAVKFREYPPLLALLIRYVFETTQVLEKSMKHLVQFFSKEGFRSRHANISHLKEGSRDLFYVTSCCTFMYAKNPDICFDVMANNMKLKVEKSWIKEGGIPRNFCLTRPQISADSEETEESLTDQQKELLNLIINQLANKKASSSSPVPTLSSHKDCSSSTTKLGPSSEMSTTNLVGINLSPSVIQSVVNQMGNLYTWLIELTISFPKVADYLVTFKVSRTPLIESGITFLEILMDDLLIVAESNRNCFILLETMAQSTSFTQKEIIHHLTKLLIKYSKDSEDLCIEENTHITKLCSLLKLLDRLIVLPECPSLLRYLLEFNVPSLLSHLPLCIPCDKAAWYNVLFESSRTLERFSKLVQIVFNHYEMDVNSTKQMIFPRLFNTMIPQSSSDHVLYETGSQSENRIERSNHLIRPDPVNNFYNRMNYLTEYTSLISRFESSNFNDLLETMEPSQGRSLVNDQIMYARLLSGNMDLHSTELQPEELNYIVLNQPGPDPNVDVASIINDSLLPEPLELMQEMESSRGGARQVRIPACLLYTDLLANQHPFLQRSSQNSFVTTNHKIRKNYTKMYLSNQSRDDAHREIFSDELERDISVWNMIQTWDDFGNSKSHSMNYRRWIDLFRLLYGAEYMDLTLILRQKIYEATQTERISEFQELLKKMKSMSENAPTRTNSASSDAGNLFQRPECSQSQDDDRTPPYISREGNLFTFNSLLQDTQSHDNSVGPSPDQLLELFSTPSLHGVNVARSNPTIVNEGTILDLRNIPFSDSPAALAEPPYSSTDPNVLDDIQPNMAGSMSDVLDLLRLVATRIQNPSTDERFLPASGSDINNMPVPPAPAPSFDSEHQLLGSAELSTDNFANMLVTINSRNVQHILNRALESANVAVRSLERASQTLENLRSSRSNHLQALSDLDRLSMAPQMNQQVIDRLECLASQISKPLIPCRGLSSLLILYITTTGDIRKAKLLSLIRNTLVNLSYHKETRDWLIYTLFSLLVHCSPSVQSSPLEDSPVEVESTNWAVTNILLSRFTITLGHCVSYFYYSPQKDQVFVNKEAVILVSQGILDLVLLLARRYPNDFWPGLEVSRDHVENASSNFWDYLNEFSKTRPVIKSIEYLQAETHVFVLNHKPPFFVYLIELMANTSLLNKGKHLDLLLNVISTTMTSFLDKTNPPTKDGVRPPPQEDLLPKMDNKVLCNLTNLVSQCSLNNNLLDKARKILINLCLYNKTARQEVHKKLLFIVSSFLTAVNLQLVELIAELNSKMELQKRKIEKEDSNFEASTSVTSGLEQENSGGGMSVSQNSHDLSNEFIAAELHGLSALQNFIGSKSTQCKLLSVMSILDNLKGEMENEFIFEDHEIWLSLDSALTLLCEYKDQKQAITLEPLLEAYCFSQVSAKHMVNEKVFLRNDTPHGSKISTKNSFSHPRVSRSLSIGGLRSTEQHPVERFIHFIEKHRAVMNDVLRRRFNALKDSAFSLLLLCPRLVDFDVKRVYLTQSLETLKQNVLEDGETASELTIIVSRENVFEDSFVRLYRRSVDDWRMRFIIVFQGEEGQDAGGLLREWFLLMSRAMFTQEHGLFKTSSGDGITYIINPNSYVNKNHLIFFKFIGKFVAKAINDNKLLECYFTRSFYKHILGVPIKYRDLESEDYEFYKGLEFLLEHNVNDLGYDLYFSAEVDDFGQVQTRDLIPNGSNIVVTDENKKDYVNLICQERMTGSIRKQISAFLEGFYMIVPKPLISIFTEQELELLISGMPVIDIEDLRANTIYSKYDSSSPQILWFWRCLRGMDQSDRALFLQFVTGTSRVPLGGFSKLEGIRGPQKFQINFDSRGSDRLPTAHTCFNQLDLPVYESFETLKKCLQTAIRECSEGFGLA